MVSTSMSFQSKTENLLQLIMLQKQRAKLQHPNHKLQHLEVERNPNIRLQQPKNVASRRRGVNLFERVELNHMLF